MNLQSDQSRAVQSYIDALLVEMPDIQISQSLPSVVNVVRVAAKQESALPDGQFSTVDTSQVLPENVDLGEIVPVEGISSADGLDIANKKGWSLDEGAANSAANSAFVKHLDIAQRNQQSGKRGLGRHKGYPEWVKDPLNCLTVKVANLKLALPVEFVQAVQPFQVQDIAVLDSHAPDQNEPVASWRLGFMSANAECDGVEQNAILDTARMIMPERYDKSMVSAYQHVVVLRGMNGCIAVDSIEGEVEINVRDVRWRSEHTRRVWLAGTIVEDMCAIIDADVLHRSLLADSVLDNNDDDQPG